MGSLIIVGDEAYTEAEWEALQRRREREREYDRRRYQNPERRAYMRAWRARNRERWNAYQREYMRRWRAA